eukprot:CAMPEP_0181042778 /NCGR_PEP_ID=MMETSP1070-20121207/12339_1 /TAXON_ID=265543 /ORGANISM="Minutocellus polymorphus, Strain NH13" /LENGTH=503 /DNA_ID=CAMNT_0023121029 /DNA_START=134 /DNA_END=1645 /DNA_ORIENTATION=-
MSRPRKKSEMNHFLPGGFGIDKPHPHDILSGRGGASNNHMGNKIYRTVCEHNKGLYAAAPRNEKLPIAVRIVEAVRSRDPPGRFLERKKEDKLWYEVTEKRAVDKTAQALREKVHKAIMLRLGEIPEDFADLVGEETEAAALAAAELAAEAAPALKPMAATKKRRSSDKTGEKGSGSNKKVKLDNERFALPSKLRNISFGGFFQSAAAGSRSDTTGSQPPMPPLPGAHVEPPLEANSTHTDSNLLVQTALAPSASLFNFFGLLGRGTSTIGGDDGGNGNNAAAAAIARPTCTAEDGDDRKPAASGTVSKETVMATLDGSPRRKNKGLTAATADARAVVETQAAVRETSLTRDISSFLPSFLERGMTGLVATATSLGTGISGIFSGTSGGSMPSPGRNAAAGAGGGGGDGRISQITQGGAAAAPVSSAIGVGHDDLVVPPPPSGGLNRGNTLTGDDDFEEDPSLERLRMIPPSLNGPQNGPMPTTMPMSMSIMPTDDRKKSSLL